MVVRCSTNESEILFFNRGRSTYGFAFCPYCGRMEYEQSPDYSENVLAGHKHLSTGLPCPGGDAMVEILEDMFCLLDVIRQIL